MSGIEAANAVAGLRARPAGYSVIDRCLQTQADAAPTSWLARQLGLSPLSSRAKPLYQDAVGEIRVAEVLDRLGDEWTVFHSVPLATRGADVDHLLIGPPGVFTVDSRAVRGPVWVGGSKILVGPRRVDFAPWAERVARRVHAELSRVTGESVFVRPLLVFVQPDRISVRTQPASVDVLTDADLVEWLRGQERIYPASRVRELASAADAVETWHDGSGHGDNLRRLLPRFERLRAEVDEARRRWGMTLFAGALSATVAAAGVLLLTVPALLVGAR
jgi:hypothetical protein